MIYKSQNEELNFTLVQNSDISDTDLNVREIGHSKTPPGTKKGPWMRDVYILHYVVAGKGLFNGEPVGKGQGFLICPNQLHSFYADELDPWEHYWIMFHGLKVNHYLHKMNMPPVNHLFEYSLDSDIIPVFDRFINRESFDSCSCFDMLSILYHVFSLHAGNTAQNERRRDLSENYVEKAISFIRLNYQNGIKIEDVAAHVNISPKYLCRLFRQYAECTPQGYLIKTRLNRAEELMQLGHPSIQQVAYSVGYNSASDFSHIYKKYRKITPSEYKNS